MSPTPNLMADLRRAYDHGANCRDTMPKQDWKIAERHASLHLLDEQGCERLLEVGAGTGQHSEFFTHHGLAVTAIDLSVEMVNHRLGKESMPAS